MPTYRRIDKTTFLNACICPTRGWFTRNLKNATHPIEADQLRMEETLTMFEHRTDKLLPRPEFLKRMARSAGICLGVVAFSLTMGTAGYHFFGELPWLDALLNASMILAGMGPVDPVRSAEGKLFATGYALYSGVAFLTTMAILLAPLAHRFMHKFHLDDEG